MALTPWSPATQLSRGNIAVGLVEAVADINNPHLAELSDGVSIDCAITTFNGTSSTDSETIDWLCDTQSEQLPTSTTHSIDDLLIKGTGQADQALLSALGVGDTIYIWRRDGLPHGQALATGQMVWVWKCIVTSVDPAEANNTFVGLTVHITVLARSNTAVAISA